MKPRCHFHLALLRWTIKALVVKPGSALFKRLEEFAVFSCQQSGGKDFIQLWLWLKTMRQIKFRERTSSVPKKKVDCIRIRIRLENFVAAQTVWFLSPAAAWNSSMALIIGRAARASRQPASLASQPPEEGIQRLMTDSRSSCNIAPCII